MHITLIGMSNIGKSYWSQRMAAEQGFERITCDSLIEHKLAPELAKNGYAGIRDVAKWMGQPFDRQYPETSATYSAFEREVMQEAIAHLKADTKPLVIDTTGSVIYTGDDIAEQLRALSRVVYFEASAAHVSQLFKRYIHNPKPVIWGDTWAPRPGEAPQEAVKRCYPELLRHRAARYASMAHVTIPQQSLRRTTTNLMALIDPA